MALKLTRKILSLKGDVAKIQIDDSALIYQIVTCQVSHVEHRWIIKEIIEVNEIFTLSSTQTSVLHRLLSEDIREDEMPK